MDVRKARASDIEAAVALAERSRRQYQKYQPAFWHKAEKSAAVTQTFFARLLAENDAFFLARISQSRVCETIDERPQGLWRATRVGVGNGWPFEDERKGAAKGVAEWWRLTVRCLVRQRAAAVSKAWACRKSS